MGLHSRNKWEEKGSWNGQFRRKSLKTKRNKNREKYYLEMFLQLWRTREMKLPSVPETISRFAGTSKLSPQKILKRDKSAVIRKCFCTFFYSYVSNDFILFNIYLACKMYIIWDRKMNWRGQLNCYLEVSVVCFKDIKERNFYNLSSVIVKHGVLFILSIFRVLLDFYKVWLRNYLNNFMCVYFTVFVR